MGSTTAAGHRVNSVSDHKLICPTFPKFHQVASSHLALRLFKSMLLCCHSLKEAGLRVLITRPFIVLLKPFIATSSATISSPNGSISSAITHKRLLKRKAHLTCVFKLDKSQGFSVAQSRLQPSVFQRPLTTMSSFYDFKPLDSE